MVSKGWDEVVQPAWVRGTVGVYKCQDFALCSGSCEIATEGSALAFPERDETCGKLRNHIRGAVIRGIVNNKYLTFLGRVRKATQRFQAAA